MKKGIIIVGVLLACSVGVAAIAINGSRPYSPTLDSDNGVSFSEYSDASGGKNDFDSSYSSYSNSGSSENDNFGDDSSSADSSDVDGSDNVGSDNDNSSNADGFGSDSSGGAGGNSASVPHVHSYVVKSSAKATCTSGGQIVYACACGDSYTDYIAAPGHNYGTIDENDYIRTYKCSRCESITRKSTFSTEALKAKLDNSLKEEIAEAYNTVQAILENAATEKYENFEIAYNGYISLILKAEQNYRTLYALAAANGETYSGDFKQAEFLREQYLKNSALLFKAISDSAFCERFYSEENGWREETKNKALELCDLYSYNDYLEACKKADEIANEINSLCSNDEAFNEKISKLYADRVNNDKILGTIFGFDENNFMSYAYKIRYARDYLPQNTEDVKTHIKNEIVPLFINLYEELYGDGKQAGSHGIFSEAFYNSPKYSLAFSEYLKALGEACGADCYSQINSAFKNGYILTGESLGAFTLKIDKNTAVSYFGEDNNNVFSLAHEVGHAFCNDDLLCSFSPDVAETAATLNESCFLAYITSDDCTVFSDEEKESIEKQKILSFAKVIILAAAIDDFEFAVYSDWYNDDFETIDSDNYDLLFEQILNDYGVGGFDGNYWQNAAISDGGYYFSYAISSLTALNEYYLAKSVGYSEALTRYGNFLAEINGSCGSELGGVKACANYFKNGRFKINYKKAIASANMASPFEDSFYVIFEPKKD